jgi:2-phospho-L-lactate guanylyltransferase
MTAVNPIQATVRDYDPAQRSGTVVKDDGTLLHFQAAAFDRSGLRLLRSGQRVRLALDGGGSVTSITLLTFPDPPPEERS